jgi:hypothetical protein
MVELDAIQAHFATGRGYGDLFSFQALVKDLFPNGKTIYLSVDLNVPALLCAFPVLPLECLRLPELRNGSGDSLDDITLFYSL